MVFNQRVFVVDTSKPIGSRWTITQSGTFVVEATGKYEIELHGGGGGGDYSNTYSVSVGMQPSSAGGAGSGEVVEAYLQKGDSVQVVIGAGGTGGYRFMNTQESEATDGGATSFGDISIGGGGQGYSGISGGTTSGSLATAGEYNQEGADASGGLGNKNKPSQTYGNGGGAADRNSSPGQPGAVILTLTER